MRIKQVNEVKRLEHAFVTTIVRSFAFSVTLARLQVTQRELRGQKAEFRLALRLASCVTPGQVS